MFCNMVLCVVMRFCKWCGVSLCGVVGFGFVSGVDSVMCCSVV